jgi:hypothetical protein
MEYETLKNDQSSGNHLHPHKKEKNFFKVQNKIFIMTEDTSKIP